MNVKINKFDFNINDGHEWYWSSFNKNHNENFIYDSIDKSFETSMFWDIGAWVGPVSLYASKIFNKVIAFEPDFIANQKLLQNIKDNNITNIEILSEGVYKEKTELFFGEGVCDRGGSTSSINSEKNNFAKIKTITLEECVERFGTPDLCKIDIEGGEEYIIDDLIKYKFKRIFIEIHPPHMFKDFETFRKKFEILMNDYICVDKDRIIYTELERSNNLFLVLK
jgi:FkbM family methyltransferase